MAEVFSFPHLRQSSSEKCHDMLYMGCQDIYSGEPLL